MVHVFMESHDLWGRKSPLLEADSLVNNVSTHFFQIAFVLPALSLGVLTS